LFCGLSTTSAHEIPKGAVPLQLSQDCASCHPQIFKEWQESFHAKSSVHKDAAHKAMHQAFVKTMQAKAQPSNYHCGNCHTPMADNLEDLISGKAEPNSANPTETEGVGCAFCHRIEQVNEVEQLNQYTLNKDGTYYTSRAANGKAPHKTARLPLFADGEVCMGCHSRYVNHKSTAMCALTECGEGKPNCITCHMEQVAGAPAAGSTATTHRSHRMMGGHDIEMLRKAATLDAEITVEGGEKVLHVQVKNIIDHTFPSTNPMRMVVVKIVAKDKAGQVLWENFREEPLREDEQAVFFKAFTAEGKVGVPYWEAEAVAFDTRLKAGESRTLSYSLDNPAISTVDVTLLYMLFPPKAIDAFAIPKDGVNEKKYPVAKKTLTL
jgi:nitrate reductase cytochrome c-type subunit